MDFPECEQFKDVPHRYANCRGERLSPEKTAKWRINVGVDPNPDNATAPQRIKQGKSVHVVSGAVGKQAVGELRHKVHKSAPRPERVHQEQPSQPATKSNGCGGCGTKKAPLTVASLNGHGPGSRLWQHYEAAGMPHCDACLALAVWMDEVGVDVCRASIETIVNSMLPRAKTWMKQQHPWFHAWLPGVVETAGLKVALRADVERAINAAS